ncbi:DUF4268 domain-containing protein [Methanobacterium sp.]|uniref:DUF4268 domain-containing protein n=1 Tax=Methanobacterium sp. TaxID=2164 RepID=UPI002AB849B1|nr:DUF4268 domain-containing protein [Methanobacterium sp.]MDY9924380.1 DUF4268 domain-containing protein [Methanobacterium sp.]
MILLVNEQKQLEKLIDEENFSKMGVLERTHMEEWIAEYPEILGEKLIIITTEYDSFDKTNNRLDILAVDEEGKLVVIELKRDIADKFVDLQAIHYAAYCSTLTLEQVADIKAVYEDKSKDEIEIEILDFIENKDFSDFDNQPRIILVANDFNEETLAAVLWLRDIGVDITCVKLEAYKLDKKIIITPDIIIPLPEAKQFMMYREEKTKNTTYTHPNEMSNFWNKVLNKLRELKPEIPEKRPYKSSYFTITTEYPNIHFEWMFRKRPLKRFMVCLHFETPERSNNKKLLDHFNSRKEEIEEKLPNNKIIFDENWGKQGTQIYIQKDSIELDEENVNWGAETMLKFYETFKPLLDEYLTK